MRDYRVVSHCRICGSSNLFPYLSLPDSPLCNKLNDIPKESPKYPVSVLLCEDCFLSQLSIVVDPKILYSNYPYQSSVSETFRNHCSQMARSVKSNFTFKNNPPSCMDIAANDGCLLREFQKEGFVARGFEPCEELAKMSWQPEKGKYILVVPKFFNLETSLTARSWSGEDIITATNVLAHVDDIKDFIFGVKYQMEMNDKSIFIVEVPHLLNLINNTQFDTVYHEHLSYFLLKPMVRLFNICNLPIFRVEKYPIHGGSLRIYAGHASKHEIESSLKEIIDEEERQGMYDPRTYIDFSNRVYSLGERLNDLLAELKGKKIMGYGASAKGISMINYFGIGKYFHSIVDDTPAKQGKYTPGYNIPIVDFNHFKKENPDRIFILAWNFIWELIEKTKDIETEYIIPISKYPDGREVMRV